MGALDDPRGGGDLSGLACAASGGLALIWLIVAAIIHSMMIRPKEITDRTITLTRVHDDFVTEMDKLRSARRGDDWDEDGEEYEERLRRRRQRRADERTGYADEAPPEKRDAFRADRGDDSIREPRESSFREEPPRRNPDDE
jgi:hypothetical protein